VGYPGNREHHQLAVEIISIKKVNASFSGEEQVELRVELTEDYGGFVTVTLSKAEAEELADELRKAAE